MKNESTLQLVKLIPGALLRYLVAKIPLSIRHRCISICGIIALVSPLLIWISWSKAIFYLVVGGGLGALLIVFVLIVFGPEEYY